MRIDLTELPPAHAARFSFAAPFRASMALTLFTERLFQNALADGPEHEAEQPSLEVLAVAYDNHVNVGGAVGTTREGVGVAGGASPHVGVCRREDDVVEDRTSRSAVAPRCRPSLR